MPVFRASFLYILICGDGFWEILAHCHILNSSLSYTKKRNKNLRRWTLWNGGLQTATSYTTHSHKPAVTCEKNASFRDAPSLSLVFSRVVLKIGWPQPVASDVALPPHPKIIVTNFHFSLAPGQENFALILLPWGSSSIFSVRGCRLAGFWWEGFLIEMS